VRSLFTDVNAPTDTPGTFVRAYFLFCFSYQHQGA
jgi:hypothetical protein